MLYLICYDLPDTRRRNRIARLLEGYGERVQDSVFECHLDGGRLKKLKLAIQQILDEHQDKVRYYPLCGKDKADVICRGIGSPPQDVTLWLV
jgi:CRISPR-associated protein Cas2